MDSSKSQSPGYGRAFVARIAWQSGGGVDRVEGLFVLSPKTVCTVGVFFKSLVRKLVNLKPVGLYIRDTRNLDHDYASPFPALSRD